MNIYSMKHTHRSDLFLDIGLHLGWVIKKDIMLQKIGEEDFTVKSNQIIGKEDFTVKSKESIDKRVCLFSMFLENLHKEHSFTNVIHERAGFTGIKRRDPNHVYGCFLGVLSDFCFRNKINRSFVAPQTLKKLFTGDGKAAKSGMLARSVEIEGEGMRSLTHDEVDAFALSSIYYSTPERFTIINNQ